MGEEDDVGGGLEAEVPERLQQHGEQVHQVEEAERGQQLVEEAVQLLPGQQEDGGRVAWVYLQLISILSHTVDGYCVDTVSAGSRLNFNFNFSC